ncbi:MAG: ATP-binding protein [Planctomycetes bacterium]|nr:ATP-binding protein [Planctomycetota bacterium]
MNLSPEELLELVAEGEGRDLEFKRGLPRDEKVARTLCAFANTRGGILLVGVLDKGGIHGVHQPRKVMADLRRVATELITPHLVLQTTLVRVDGKAVVAAQVPASALRPHAVLLGDDDHEVVVRVGSSNRLARGATLDALRRPRNGRGSSDPLQARALTWVDERSRRSDVPGGDATYPRFAAEYNLGLQRARRVFTRLEQEGLLVGHGRGKNRVYHRP